MSNDLCHKVHSHYHFGHSAKASPHHLLFCHQKSYHILERWKEGTFLSEKWERILCRVQTQGQQTQKERHAERCAKEPRGFSNSLCFSLIPPHIHSLCLCQDLWEFSNNSFFKCFPSKSHTTRRDSLDHSHYFKIKKIHLYHKIAPELNCPTPSSLPQITLFWDQDISM